MVIPSRAAENNQQNTLNAETYVQDGIEYETIYLQGDSDPEQTKIIFNGVSTGNYRYIFQGDWDMVAHQVSAVNPVKGDHIIIDLNGHKVNSAPTSAGAYFLQLSGKVTTIEFTDSSATGGGSINVTALTSAATVIASGNGSYELGYGAKQMNFVIRGGKSVALQCWGAGGVGANLGSLILAPYIQLTNETGAGTSSSRRLYAPTHDYYAVSASRYDVTAGDQARSNLTVGQLTSQTFTEGYYLWGRKADGTYEYTDIQYTNGEWVYTNGSGIAYETIYLTGRDADNMAMIAKHGSAANNHGNFRYVMTADWRMTSRCQIYGDNVILDLNGYDLSMEGFVVNAGSYFEASVVVFELTDSSPLQTGVVRTYGEIKEPVFAFQKTTRKFIFSGGTIEDLIHIHGSNVANPVPLQIEFCGGNWRPNRLVRFCSLFEAAAEPQMLIPAYYQTTYNNSGVLTSAVTYDTYAVSTSHYVSGIHNYEYGQLYDITGRTLSGLALPADKTYYLWGRKADGAYAYLNIAYVNGVWSKIVA